MRRDYEGVMDLGDRPPRFIYEVQAASASFIHFLQPHLAYSSDEHHKKLNTYDPTEARRVKAERTLQDDPMTNNSFQPSSSPANTDTRSVTTSLINAASVLEKCDEQILPALYSRVGASLHATPTQLGFGLTSTDQRRALALRAPRLNSHSRYARLSFARYITLARAFVQALSSPLAGVSSEFYPRGTVIAAGCCIWATFTTLFACVSTLWLAIVLCAVNGLGLALVIPSVQSLTADLNSREARGTAFGSLWLVISLGGMLGALYATNVGAYKPLGIDGWRFVFVSVSFLSAIVGVLNHVYVVDDAYLEKVKRDKQRLDYHPRSSLKAQVRDIAAQIGSVMRIPTFALIILQGVVGSVPYASLVFLTLYLQLLGMSDSSASIIVGLYLIGGGFGGLLGGYIGDRIAMRYPHHGRILATQFSIGVGIPFALLLFKGLPAILGARGDPAASASASASTVVLYAVSIFTFAVLTAWPAPCCNNPIFAEIVPAHQRNLVYSFDRCFEGAVAAFATPLVGYLSESVFGFSGTSKVSGDPNVDAANAHALGNALVVFTCLPWLFAFFVYGGIHVTYPRDLERTLENERKTPRFVELRQGSRQNSGISDAGEGETDALL